MWADAFRIETLRLSDELMVPIIYKSVLFSILLVAAYILEEIVVGLFHGRGVSESLPALGGGVWSGRSALRQFCA